MVIPISDFRVIPMKKGCDLWKQFCSMCTVQVKALDLKKIISFLSLLSLVLRN